MMRKKMYNYSFSAGNPEGTDFSFFLQHEIKYSEEEFKDICEDIIVSSFEHDYKEDGCIFISALNDGFIYSKFKEKGFSSVEETATYYLEPYWGKDHIKSPKLKLWLNDQEEIYLNPKDQRFHYDLAYKKSAERERIKEESEKES